MIVVSVTEIGSALLRRIRVCLAGGDVMIAPVTDKRRPTRHGRQPRQVRLEPVVRRDAAQRLSLALTLLVRSPDLRGAAARPALLPPTDPRECSA
jgi:hypothetical protein